MITQVERVTWQGKYIGTIEHIEERTRSGTIKRYRAGLGNGQRAVGTFNDQNSALMHVCMNYSQEAMAGLAYSAIVVAANPHDIVRVIGEAMEKRPELKTEIILGLAHIWEPPETKS